MTVSEAMQQTWDAVVAEAPQNDGFYHRRIPLSSVWPAHAGIQGPAGTRIVILETDQKSVRDLRLKEETRGYCILVQPDLAGRSDRAAILIQEGSAAYRAIFEVFCADILNNWIGQGTAGEAVTTLVGRLARWRKFFQRGSPGLSREDYIGLFGELSLIEAAIARGVPSLLILNAWQAPLSTNQDFLFGETAIEVKTTTGNDLEKVRITNSRQLDTTGLQALYLVRFAFDFRQGSGRTLRQLVSMLKASFASSPDAVSVFNDRLLEAGFAENIPNEHDNWGFSRRQEDFFSVTEGFPRILEPDLRPGVSDINYTVHLSAAVNFKIGNEQLWTDIVARYG